MERGRTLGVTMRCKSCDYPLWNIATRQCPECGRGFAPSEFEFVVNSVRFCCPTCAQAYYGTGPKGHLVPESFTCVSCGNPVTMDACILLPTQGVAEEQTQTETNPWLERERLGIPKAWLGTISMAMLQPGKLIRATPVDAPGGVWFALLTNLVFGLVGWVGIGLVVLFAVLVSASAQSSTKFAGGLGMFGVGVLVAMLILMSLWAVSAHAVLRITGPTTYPLRRTVQSICYSSGAFVLFAIPCIGPYFWYIFILWWVVSAILMVFHGHQVKAWRAIAAVLTLPVLMGGAAVITLAALVFAGTSAAAAGARGPASVPPRATAPMDSVGRRSVAIASALEAYAAGHGGARPFHAMVLIDEGMTPTDLTADPTAERFLGATVWQYYMLSRDQQRVFRDRARELMDDGVVAHRYGDVVFTYHGIDPGSDPDLWLAVITTPLLRGGCRVYLVVQNNYLGRAVAVEDFASELEKENRRRGSAGLSPLPDLFAITPDEPARRAGDAGGS